MTCRQVRSMLSMRRELAERERTLVEDHLTGCPSCHTIAREYELIDLRLGRLPQPLPALALSPATQARTIIKEQTMKSPTILWRRRALEGIALIAVVALVFLVTWQLRGPYPVSVLDPSTALTTAQRTPLPDVEPLWVAQLGEQVRLLGYNLELGVPLHLKLYWQSQTKVEDSYAVFVHLLDGDSNVWAQQDRLPGNGDLPTTEWQPGEMIVDEYDLVIAADAPSGDYVIGIGMYETETGRRLPVTGADGQTLGYGFSLKEGFYWFGAQEDTTSRFSWPTLGCLSQAYWSGHRAIDIASLSGTPVTAAADGTVVLADQDAEYGKHVLLDHSDGYETFYAHLLGASVTVGEVVKRQQQIGTVGSTGKSTGPHLHFEIYKDGVPLDPFEVVVEEVGGRRQPLASGTGAHVSQEEASTAGYVWPVSGVVTQGYSSTHRASDIASRTGAPVHAVADGTVVLSDLDDHQHGIHVLVDHGDGYESFYSHLSAAHLEAGQEVEIGQQIGEVGSTGMATGPHLHLEIRRDGIRLNPFDVLPEIEE